MIVKLMTKSAIAPLRTGNGAAGFDIFSDQGVTIQPNELAAIKTGVSIANLNGCYFRISQRAKRIEESSMVVIGDVVDGDEPIELTVRIHNLGASPLVISKGDAIASLFPERVWYGCINVD